MTNEAIEYRTVTAETITTQQIRWVYGSATARRVASACRLLLEFDDASWPIDDPDARPSYEAARQTCAEAWNAGRALAGRRLRVDASLLLPRPSPRIITSAEERATAMDWYVSATVRDWSLNDDQGAIAMQGEGSVTLYQPAKSREPEVWAPCRHCSVREDGEERSWLHGNLLNVIKRLEQLSPMGIEVARQLVIAVSGEGMRMKWTDPSEAHPRLIDLNPEGVIPGDIIEHNGSHRVGVVQPEARVCRDRTVEHPVHIFGDERPMQWNSSRIRRLLWEDPYRRYLALRWRADSDGLDVSTQDWARLAIELSGAGMPGDATATHRKIALVNPRDAREIRRARAHWWAAANDCSRRVGGVPAALSLFRTMPEP